MSGHGSRTWNHRNRADENYFVEGAVVVNNMFEIHWSGEALLVLVVATEGVASLMIHVGGALFEFPPFDARAAV